MSPLLVLVGSPVLGSLVWEPVALELRRAGHEVRVVPRHARALLDTPEEALGDLLEEVPQGRPVVVVAHSQAGLYVPLLSRSRDVVAVVFVDAALPPERHVAPLAPAPLLEHLAPRADRDGRLPGWTGWWDAEDLDAVLGPGVVRAEIESEQPRAAIAYLRSAVAVPDGWDESLPVAYLGFGDTYAEEIRHARSLGWPTVVLDGAHLHTVVDPAGVAAAVADLVGELGGRAGPQ